MCVQIGKGWLRKTWTGKAEIAKFYIIVIIWEYILRFQVSVKDFHGREVLKYNKQLVSYFNYLLII